MAFGINPAGRKGEREEGKKGGRKEREKDGKEGGRVTFCS